MSRIKHPVRAIREPFGTAGLVIACIALVLALTGAAFAAGSLTSKQKKEVEKIAKKFAGKPGANGTPGQPGQEGKAGANGTNGKNGKSVAASSFPGGSEPPGKPCQENGGNSFEVEGSGTQQYACNGKEGSPWTAGGTLPKGKSEKGAFSGSLVETPAAGPGVALATASVSFPIPLSSKPTVVYLNESHEEGFFEAGELKFRSPVNCLGTLEEPKANQGFLCLYLEVGPGTPLEPTGFKSGAVLPFSGSSGAAGFPAAGTWAVTAE